MIPPRLSQLLTRWEESFDQGRDLGPTELCPDEPELHASLKAEIDRRRQNKARTLVTDGPAVAQATLTTPEPLVEAPAAPRARVPGYEIEGELGRGGMGVVYQARHLALNRRVALKMILHADHAGPEERLRFLGEAEAVAAIQHPGIVQVHDLGATPDGLPYLALEYCPGGSLSAKLSKSPLSPADAAALVEQLARAVQAAHDKGILHRDLKPGNILFDELGQPKITDFGLARRVEGHSELTRTGAVVGTPSYMPPEQASGVTRQLTPAVDVYALGAILYECLTGRPPFQAATPIETIMEVLQRDPAAVRALQPRVPRDLETICHKCLQKAPPRRYASASDLAEDLRRFREGQPIAARPVGAMERGIKWVQRRPAVAAMLALVVLVTIAGVTGIWLAYREAVRERDAALAANERRLHGLIEQLLTADPQSVPGTLEAMRAEREAIAPLLEARWDQAEWRSRRERGRLALALVLVERRPEEAVPVLRDRLLEAEGPGEVLVLREALATHAESLREPLWRVAEEEKQPRGVRFRALAALAGLAPRSGRWRNVAALGAGELVQSNPLYLEHWARALRPVRDELRGELVRAFRSDPVPTRRQAAAVVLRDYLADEPDALGELLPSADPDQLRTLWPSVQRRRAGVVRRLKAKLREEVAAPWPEDATKFAGLTASGKPRDEWKAAVAEVEAAQGMAEAGRFAICQSLPLGRAAAVNRALRHGGLGLIRFRPYAVGNEVKVAAVWRRVAGEDILEVGLTAEQVRARDKEVQAQGLRPVDVAGYVEGDNVRYAVAWRKMAGERRLFVAESRLGITKRVMTQLSQAGLRPATFQVHVAEGQEWCSGIWERPPEAGGNYYWAAELSEAGYEGQLGYLDYCMVDVSTYPTTTPVDRAGHWRRQRDQALGDVAKSADNLAAWWQLGQARFHLGEYREALVALDKVLARGSYYDVHYLRAALRAWSGNAAGAWADRKGAITAASRKTYAVNLDATLLAFLGRPEEALRLLDGVGADTAYEREAVARTHARIAGRLRMEVAAGAMAALGAGGAGPLAALTVLPAAPRLHRHYHTFCQRSAALLEQALPGLAEPEWLGTDLGYAPLRGEPRFERLLAGLPVGRRYASVRHLAQPLTCVSLHGLSPQEQLARWRRLAAEGRRPAAVAVTRQADGTLVAASLWHAPLVEETARVDLARDQGAAAALLWRLGERDEVWPLLWHTPTPDVRSYLLSRLTWAGVPAEEVVDRLTREVSPSARRALILALGEYGAEALPAALRKRVEGLLLKWYDTDPDAGVHGAISWLLRPVPPGEVPTQHKFDWGLQKVVDGLDRAHALLRPWQAAGETHAATWALSPRGETFVIVPPADFVMGESSRQKNNLALGPHARRVARPFAIAATNLLQEDWDAFRKAHPKLRLSASATFRGDYASYLGWYDVAQYCRWRSEQEQVPLDQMCFPTLEEIERCKLTKAPLVLPPDYLKRTGYRMPTAAEAELAARAGSVTSYPHGSGTDLLGRYAWHGQAFMIMGAGGMALPIASRRGLTRPNDFGLFDLPGNPPFYCLSRAIFPVPARVGQYLPETDEQSITADANVVSRGGYPLLGAHFFRSASQNFNKAEVASTAGARLVRTWPVVR